MGDSGGVGDKKAQIDLACSTAENFSKLFYDKMDNKRHTIAKMYLETATASWNGNKVDGSADIQKFYLDKLPKTVSMLSNLLVKSTTFLSVSLTMVCKGMSSLAKTP